MEKEREVFEFVLKGSLDKIGLINMEKDFGKRSKTKVKNPKVENHRESLLSRIANLKFNSFKKSTLTLNPNPESANEITTFESKFHSQTKYCGNIGYLDKLSLNELIIINSLPIIPGEQNEYTFLFYSEDDRFKDQLSFEEYILSQNLFSVLRSNIVKFESKGKGRRLRNKVVVSNSIWLSNHFEKESVSFLHELNSTHYGISCRNNLNGHIENDNESSLLQTVVSSAFIFSYANMKDALKNHLKLLKNQKKNYIEKLESELEWFKESKFY